LKVIKDKDVKVKNFYNYLICFFILSCGSLAADDYLRLTLDVLGTADVDQFKNQDVEVSGYLYEKAVGEWVLSSEPNHKSCCAGNAKQLHVLGDTLLPSLEKTVTVQGVLKPASEANKYVLDQAKIIHTNRETHFPWTTFLVIGGIVLGAVGLRNYFKF
jgi:hypothetical protein